MRILLSNLVCCLLLWSCSYTAPYGEGTLPPFHYGWTSELSRFVDDDGMVHYAEWQLDQQGLDAYLSLLGSHLPNPQTWTKEEQIAYWVNAYNAFTVKLVLDHYPLGSITDLHPWPYIPFLRTVWHRKFELGGEPISLDEIEHKILRGMFEEPRIHFAINCASFSCPVLMREAYEAESLEEQLEAAARRFINDPLRNRLSEDKAELSSIFSWFSGDFTRSGSLVEYINRYSDQKMKAEAKIRYMDYNWDLNDAGSAGYPEGKPQPK